MVDEQNDKQQHVFDALLDGLHAPVTPQPKPQPKPQPQPTPEPTPEHDYYLLLAARLPAMRGLR